jgi:hypothetical protein
MGFLDIIINDELAFQYDRSTVLDDRQLAFVEQMDRDMDRGIRMYGELITEPDSKQKARFVAMNLLKGLQQQDNARIEVSCAYLGSRLPQVVEVHARDMDGRVNIEFIEEH